MALSETILALVLMSLIAVAFISGLTTAGRATLIADEQATAESLARSEMEYAKSQPYIDYSNPGHGEYQNREQNPEFADYNVDVDTTPIDPNTGEPIVPPTGDEGIQKITVVVEYNGKSVFTIEDYRVDR
ncbi:hypothetical protein ACFLWT_01310 [Chloroflexota bacterium]